MNNQDDTTNSGKCASLNTIANGELDEAIDQLCELNSILELFAERLADGGIQEREASNLGIILFRARPRLEKVIHLLDREQDARMVASYGRTRQ